ncbi:CRHBP protein, partial [Leiothrix lutea]|nr:CRHBP protein [Leiothrix lutea]
MPSAFQLQCHLVLIFLAASKGETRYLERQQPFVPASPGCIDMLSIEGQFSFTADQPQLHCATFFIGEPEELITVHYDFVNIDCQGGDFLKVRGCKSLLSDSVCVPPPHRTPLKQSQTQDEDPSPDYSAGSSELFQQHLSRVSIPGGMAENLVSRIYSFPSCNVISQTPSGRFTMVIPHQHRNCSFSIIYPVVIKISDLILGHLNGLFLKKPSAGCAGVGDFVELLGGAGLDPSKMFPLADLCHSFHGSAQMKIGCDNTVLRMVSSGKHVNRVTFEYHQLDLQETETRKENSIEEFCFPSI